MVLSLETLPSPPTTPKHHRSGVVIAIALFAMFVGCLVTATWLAGHFISRYLGQTQIYGNVVITPFGYETEGLLHHSWDSIRVLGDGIKITIKHPAFRGHFVLSPKEDFLQLTMDSVVMRLAPTQFKSLNENPLPNNFTFPNIRIPFQASIKINHIETTVDSVGKWSLDSLRIVSLNKQTIGIDFQNFSGSHVERKVGMQAKYAWNSDFVDLGIKLKTEDNDSILCTVNAPRLVLQNFSGDLTLSVKNPETWLPGILPQGIPTANNLNLDISFSADVLKKRFSYKGELQSSIGEFWPLPPLFASIHFSGNEKGNYVADGKFVGDEGGEINLQGSMDKNLNGMLRGSIENISAEFGFLMMPLDITIHSAKKSGDSLVLDLETRRGSKVSGTITHLTTDPKITFNADIDENETWALDWCTGNLRLGSRPQIQGSFYKGKLRAKAVITPVEYAYFMKVDYLEVKLVLDENGIIFSDGLIRAPNETYTFTGDVMWEDSIPHTSWKVHQGAEGYAEAWISFDADLFVKADHVQLATIPFADSTWRKGMDGIVSGNWEHHFSNNTGIAEIYAETQFKQFPIKMNLKARENGDSLFLDKAEFFHQQNKIEAEAIALLHRDTIADTIMSVSLVQAWASTHEFNIPILLSPFEITTLRKGSLSGDISYHETQGIQGNLDFDTLALEGVSDENFLIPRLNLFAEKDKVEINGNVILGNGGWNGNTQIIIDHILNDSRHISASHTAQNGGTFWLEGDLDTNLTWTGEVNANGAWFLPFNAGEIINTDLHVDVTAELRDGLDGVHASFFSDTTLYDSKLSLPIFPISFSGRLEKGIVSIPTVETSNDRGEKIFASVQYDIHKSQLDGIDFHTDNYTLLWDNIHEIKFENIDGHMSDSKKEMSLFLEMPGIYYTLKDPSIGKGDAKIRGYATLHLPHAEAGSFVNKSIDGNFYVDRAVFKKQLEVDIGLNSLNQLVSTLSSFFTKIRREKPMQTENTSTTSRPTNISIHVSDSQEDSVAIVANFATFPLTLDLWILGTLDHPILRGDINNSGNGFIGLEGLFQFNLESFAVSWQDVPWRRGALDVSSSQELPYCDNTENEETCPIQLNFMGSVTNPQPIPSSNCGTESSPAAIYYDILLGCIANDQSSSSIDRNKVAGKIIGGVLTSTANKTLGGEYVGDIDMKLRFFSDSPSQEKDSSYLRVPISLNRWVKDLSLVFGYTQDQSENPTYDQALEAGLNYTIPVFNESDKKQPNHYDPKLDFSGSLVSRRYVTALETDANENRIEKNIGFNYTYHFWAPCLLGLGNCPTPGEKKPGEKKKETEAKP